jgi:hypothetical protein
MIDMIVTSKINVELAQPKKVPEIYVVQDDRYSRNLQMNLLVNGIPLELQEGYTAVFSYSKPDGKKGAYDTLPDGTKAYSIRGNRIWAALAPEVCTAAGDVRFMVTLIKDKFQLGTFEICIHVKARPTGIPASGDYLNITGFLPQPADGKSGGYLKATWVDAFGRVAGVETVDLDALPLVTEAQEGAFLRVVDGKWAAAVLGRAEEVEF